ncbi:conserved membrane hypothetical protein [Hyella patelloides LEGE 07179]|uniref:O-antigen polymerase n=1 Tax=Hyella patelloides LEGE 07179 TaxID=945734 RepID=A0A563VMQ7_9CYAN|nr:YfhO family protein [Hyella patelloides]VEP12701.1 conserved membrane hypothetical protein [Hyella patelloides LEGE 07179]
MGFVANSQKTVSAKKKGYLRNSTLVIIAFASVFFPRCLEAIGFPAPINFVHFIIVPFSCLVVLLTSRNHSQKQRMIVRQLLTGLLIFFGVVITSAFFNGAGTINAFLSYMLLTEPFFLLVSFVSLPLSLNAFKRFRTWLVSFLGFHLFLVYIQKYLLQVDTWEHLGMSPPDRIQGVFFISGSGHVVGASVSFTFAVYCLMTAKFMPLWLRIFIASAAFWHIIIADAKQVIMVFMVAGCILFLLKFRDPVVLIKYLTGGIAFGYAFLWCVNNVAAFKSFNTWADPELYGPNGQATLGKTTAFRVIPSHYQSPLNWWLGLGPGHTVGRLGGWMLREYRELLKPLGATIHEASSEVWQEGGSFFIVSRSSLFSPLFGWAGIWGDLGILGLAAYLWLALLVWHYLCVDDLSKFLMLTVFVFGLIFSQMEEPGYMLSVATIIGLQWQEKQMLRG